MKPRRDKKKNCIHTAIKYIQPATPPCVEKIFVSILIRSILS